MLHGIYYKDIHEGPNLELNYPSRAKHPKEVLTVKDIAHAERLWNIRTRKYIFDTLRGWALQRKHAMNIHENNFKYQLVWKNAAVERLLFCLMTHYESPLQLLVRRISQAKKDIEIIAPSANSRFINHYEEVIQPIVDWCEACTKQFDSKKNLN